MVIQDFVSREFMTKDGRTVRTQAHIATFNESHNASKSKMMMCLYKETHGGISVGTLHRLSGVDYGYLRSKLSRWVSWGYVVRKVSIPEKGRPIFLYSLGERGRHFVDDILPKPWLQQYAAEIRQHRASQGQ